MGGDDAPTAPVQGAVQFAKAHPLHEVVLVGDAPALREALRRADPPTNVSIRHASEVVGIHDAASAVRTKRDSSIRICFELAKAGEVAAVVSAGNSGAVMAGALLVLGRLQGVERPAIAALFPALRGRRCLLLDAGANVECRPTQLAQFAVMGEAYVRRILGVVRPKVAVLSNGEEPSKGTALTREASALLRESDLDFTGYAEGKDIFAGELDVVVTDGFTGNVVLKTSEGTALGVVGLIRQAIDRSGLPERVGALLLKPTLVGLRKVVDYAEYGGAPLLGVAGVGIVAHGRSNPKAIANALRAALTNAQVELPLELQRALDRAHGWLPARRPGKEKGGAALEHSD
jgi:phosphate acyltransferase